MVLRNRIESMDFFRGLAILLMFLDHIAFLIGEGIEYGGVRYLTRLSEPLFAIIFGYFLLNKNNEEKKLFGFIRLFIATVLVNVLYFTFTGSFDILLSFLGVYVIYSFLGEKIIYLSFLILLFNLDPSLGVVDYPLSLVLAQVGFGMLLRKNNKLGSFLVFVLTLISSNIIQDEIYVYVSQFTLLAMFMIYLAIFYRKMYAPIVNEVGKRPLVLYVGQFYLAVALGIIYFLLS